jgi:threonine dehydrogenase-like Zn-dependent dehydrogenase
MSEPLDAILAAVRGTVEVAGDGPAAAALRERLADRAPPTGEAPETVIETSGRPEALERAMARVADLGTVVAAGSPPTPDSTIDLYADLHVRGLTLILPAPAPTQ